MRTRSALAALAAAGLTVVLASGPVAAAGSSPWTDPTATGTITFCDRAGTAVTHGAITDTPWVWKAVGSAPPPAPFGASGAVAQLYLFAPVKGALPSSWVGEAMAGGSTYTDVAHPAAMSTSLDLSLATFLGDFRSLWDGYLQARLVYGREGYGTAQQYAAVTIKVTGDSWEVVGPVGTASCAAGKAVSDEIAALKLPASGVAPTPSSASTRSTRPSAAPTVSPGQMGSADDPVPASSGPGSDGRASARPTSASSTTEPAESLASVASASSPAVPLAAIVLLLGLVAVVGALIGRRTGGHR